MKRKYQFIWKENDKVQIRYEVLREVWEGANISEVCDKYGWSKEKYYYWHKRHKIYGMLGLFEPPLDRKVTPDVIRKVIVLKEARDLSIPDLTKFANSLGCVELSENSIREIINEYKDRNVDKLYMDEKLKLEESLRKELDNIEQGEYTIGPKTNDRIQKAYELIREVWTTENPKIQEICNRYGFHRNTFLYYHKRFKEYGMLGLVNKQTGQKGPRKVNLDVEIKIVKQKLDDKKKSTYEIADGLNITAQRVWSILENYNLNKQQAQLKEEEKAILIKETADEVCAEDGFLDCVRYMAENKIPTAYPGLFILAVFLNMLKIDKLLASVDMGKDKGKEMFRIILLNINRIFAGIPVIGRVKYFKDHGLPLSCGMSSFPAYNTLHTNKFRVTPEITKYLRIELGKIAKRLGIFNGRKLACDPHLTYYHGKKVEELDIGKAYDTKRGRPMRGHRPLIFWDVELNSLVTYSPHNGNERGSKIVIDDIEYEVMSVTGKAPELILLDREFTSVPVIQALYHDRKIHVIEAVRKHKGVKNLLSEINKNNLWVPVDEEIDIGVKAIDTDNDIYLIAKRDKAKKKIWCFETTITEKNKELIETKQQKRKSMFEIDVIEYFRFRWLVENGLIDLVHGYFLDKIPTPKPGGPDFHYWCVMVAYFAVKLCKKYAEYLFSLKPEYKQYMKNSEVDEQLRMAFMDKNISLSSDAKIFKRGRKNWSITDRSKTYKIVDMDERLEVYEASILSGEWLSVLRDVFIRGFITYLRLERNTLILSMPALGDRKAQSALENMFKRLKEKKLNGPINWLGGLYIDIEFNTDFINKM